MRGHSHEEGNRGPSATTNRDEELVKNEELFSADKLLHLTKKKAKNKKKIGHWLRKNKFVMCNSFLFIITIN